VTSMTSELVGKGLHKTCNCTCSHVCTMVYDGERSVLSSRCNAHQKTYVSLIVLWTSVVCSLPMDAKCHK
jgi:hypothetical protein